MATAQITHHNGSKPIKSRIPAIGAHEKYGLCPHISDDVYLGRKEEMTKERSMLRQQAFLCRRVGNVGKEVDSIP